MIPTREQYAVAHAIFAYQYNTSGQRFVKDVYGDVHPNYAHEKATTWGESQARAAGLLDELHFGRLVGAALERYGHEGAMRASLAIAAGAVAAL